MLRKSPKRSVAYMQAQHMNAEKSTGPRSDAGKSKSNARKPAPDAPAALCVADLGEAPQDYTRLVSDLNASFLPATPAESMLVQDLAELRWKRRRLGKIEENMLVRKAEELEQEQLNRHIEAQQEVVDLTPEELSVSGLRAARDSSAKFETMSQYLDTLITLVEHFDFEEDAEHIFNLLYGKAAGIRGRTLCGQFKDLKSKYQGMGPGEVKARLAQGSGASGPDGEGATEAARGTQTNQVCDELIEERTAYQELRVGLLREMCDVIQRHQAFMEQYVRLTPAFRKASLLPNPAEWRTLRQQTRDVERQIERKTQLLMRMQKSRQD